MIQHNSICDKHKLRTIEAENP